MALRQLEITIPENTQAKVRNALADVAVISTTFQSMEAEQTLVRILIETTKTEAVIDHLERNFSHDERFRITILPVEGTIPVIKPRTIIGQKASPQRINRVELLNDLASGVNPNRVFFATVLLSAMVAAIGLLRDDVAIIIGAMVIAPLLTPNMALALGTTLGDMNLVRKALKTTMIGVFLTVSFSIVLGFFSPPNLELAAIKLRTEVSVSDLILALAAGSAGALAFTTGVSAALVGVMVAVALMPPLVVFGLLLGSNHVGMSSGALLLFSTNIICVNLSGVLTFLAQGIRPKTWWETGRAKKATRIAILIWGSLLVILIWLLAFFL